MKRQLKLTAIKSFTPKGVGMYCVNAQGTKSPYQGVIRPMINGETIMVKKNNRGNYEGIRSRQIFSGNTINLTCYSKHEFLKNLEGIDYMIEETSNYYDEDTMVEEMDSEFLGFEQIKESKNYTPVIVALLLGLVVGYIVAQKYGKIL